MDANKVIEDLIGVFLVTDLENFKTNIMAVESVMKKNHEEIIDFLHDIGVSDVHINILKEKLKVI